MIPQKTVRANDFSKPEGYIQNQHTKISCISIYLQWTRQKQIVKAIQFTIASKRIKYFAM